jgi:spore germination protein
LKQGARAMSFFMKVIQSFIKQNSQKKVQEDDVSPSDEKNLIPTLKHTLEEFSTCADLVRRSFPQLNVDIVYFGHLVGSEELKRDIIEPLTNIRPDELQLLFEESQFEPTNTSKDLIKGVLDGQVAIFHENLTYLVNAYAPPSRSIQQSESETVITGPHDAFVESAGYNHSLLRRRVRSSHLKVVKLEVGEVAKTDVYILYIVDLVDRQLVDELIFRIKNMEIDGLQDTNMLVQYIDESPNSFFSQFLTTERTDVAASKLISGRIVGIVDNSPSVLCAPTSFFDFFSSPDYYYQRWLLGTGIRLLRFFAFFITVSFTALYVSSTF